jgi:hypothetical protein
VTIDIGDDEKVKLSFEATAAEPKAPEAAPAEPVA